MTNTTTKKNNFRLSKKKIQKILVPLDGSKFSICALNFAINMSKFTNSHIVGIFVISSDVSAVPLETIFNPLSELEPKGYKAKMTKQGQKILEQAETRCLQNSIKFTKVILYGNPGYGIVEYAKNRKNGIDLIIMGSKGHGHAEEILLGSVSYNVVHKSKKPVMIIK